MSTCFAREKTPCRHEALTQARPARFAIPGVLHTIIFNRSLGYVFPKDVDSDLFDITYVSPRSQAPLLVPGKLYISRMQQ